MANIIQVIGKDEILNKLKKYNIELGWRFALGLKEAGLFLQRMSQKVVPIDKSILKNSAGTKVLGSSFFTDVVVYYTASYAVYVHERTDLKHKKGKQAKFLEGPAKIYKIRLLNIIARRSRGK